LLFLVSSQLAWAIKKLLLTSHREEQAWELYKKYFKHSSRKKMQDTKCISEAPKQRDKQSHKLRRLNERYHH
jgi:hypothetical protein